MVSVDPDEEILFGDDPFGPAWNWAGCGLAGPPATRTMVLRRKTILDHLQATGHQYEFGDAVFVPDVTRNPTAIFEGLNRPDQDEALCYAGHPNGDFCQRHGLTVPNYNPAKFIFLVFLTQEMIITKYRFARVAADDQNKPHEYDTRFRRTLWQI